MLNQDNRTLHLHVPCLGDGVLIPVEASAKEAISQSFLCSIDCISNNLTINSSKILGKNVTLAFLDKEGHKRYLNGIVAQFESGAIKSKKIRRYKLQLIPQFETLKLGSNCQFFKDMTVPEIFQSQCKKLGFHDFDVSGLSQNYLPLTYKTQFNENNFDFLSRILEEVGISYYYQHSEGAHKLMLVDHTIKFKNSKITANLLRTELSSSPVVSSALDHPALFSWAEKQTVVPLQTRMSPLNTNQPNQWDSPTMVSQGANKAAMRPSLYCTMHYPDSLTNRDSREQAQTALTNALAAEQLSSEGSGNYIDFSAGKTFQLTSGEGGQGLAVGPYLITEIKHHAFDYSYLPEDLSSENKQKVSGDSTSHYQNTFNYLNIKKASYAPKRTIKKPLIPDLQPAFVTGPKDNKNNVYTNKQGQVQVRFPWDRQGQNSCFIPVCHSAAGSNFGTQFIPRIGQEVLISYVGGNVDMPMVVGSAANGKTPPAYDLSKNPNLTWIKSNTLNSKDSKQGHHILFDDTPNREQLSIKSQKDYIEEVLNNSTNTIEGNDEIHIGGNELVHAFTQSMKLQGKTLTLSGGGSEILISEHGIELKGSASSGGVVQLCSKGAGPMKPVARLGDKYACPKHTAGTPHHGGPILAKAVNISANKRRIARQGDKGHCRITTDHIKEGIATTLINGKPIARLNHAMAHGGVITSASENVFVGEKPLVPNLIPKPLIEVAHPCVIDRFHVRCQHDERSFQLHPLTDKPNVDDQKYVLQVIGSDKVPDKLLLFFNGQCHQHPQILSNCPQVEVTGPDSCQVVHDNQLIEVYGPSNTGVTQDFLGFLKQILLPLSNPNQYQLLPSTCIESGPEVMVDVYPPVKWEGELKLGYEFEKEKLQQEIEQKSDAMHASKGQTNAVGQTNSESTSSSFEEKGSWGIDGSISISRNNETWSLGGSVEKERDGNSKRKASDVIFKAARHVMDKVAPMIASMNTKLVGTDIKLPNLKLSGGVENKEIPGQYDVGLVGNIKASFDPLFKVEVDLKILNWLIACMGPGLGSFLLDVKQRAAKGVGNDDVNASAEVNVDLIVEGNISGDVSWKKEIGQNWAFSGGIDDEVTMKLKASASAQIQVFVVHAAASVKAYADTGLKAKFKPCLVKDENTGLDTAGVEMQFVFEGLTVYYAKFCEVTTRHGLSNNGYNKLLGKSTHSKLKKEINESAKINYPNSKVVIQPINLNEKPIKVPLTCGGI